MEKPQHLRNALAKAIPYFQQNPDALQLYYTNGTMRARSFSSLSFEYTYDLEIYVTDYKASPDLFFLVVQDWLRREQWELLGNADNENAVTFEIEPLNDDSYDLMIKIPLTERVIVKDNGEALEIYHAQEPTLDDGIQSLAVHNEREQGKREFYKVRDEQ